jgi:hypothetical protein
MRLDALGLGLLLLGIIMGFLWLYVGMGVPGRMSMKIGFILLTAVTYLAGHLLRIGRGWKGQKACFISIAGFILVICTLLVGQHGY